MPEDGTLAVHRKGGQEFLNFVRPISRFWSRLHKISPKFGRNFSKSFSENFLRLTQNFSSSHASILPENLSGFSAWVRVRSYGAGRWNFSNVQKGPRGFLYFEGYSNFRLTLKVDFGRFCTKFDKNL